MEAGRVPLISLFARSTRVRFSAAEKKEAGIVPRRLLLLNARLCSRPRPQAAPSIGAKQSLKQVRPCHGVKGSHGSPTPQFVEFSQWLPSVSA